MSTVIDNDTAKRNISANVKAMLEEREMSQASLARATGDLEMTISYLVRGVQCPSAALLARVAEALGVTADALLAKPTTRARSRKAATA
jgi:transcriptional regulator with XRE-family HTH domain